MKNRNNMEKPRKTKDNLRFILIYSLNRMGVGGGAESIDLRRNNRDQAINNHKNDNDKHIDNNKNKRNNNNNKK